VGSTGGRHEDGAATGEESSIQGRLDRRKVVGDAVADSAEVKDVEDNGICADVSFLAGADADKTTRIAEQSAVRRNDLVCPAGCVEGNAPARIVDVEMDCSAARVPRDR
jgi:hypothetical protein